MHEKASVGQSSLVDGSMNRIAYLGTNTIRYILNLYCIQYIAELARFQIKTKFTIKDVDYFLLADSVLSDKITELRMMLREEECKPPLAACRDFDWFIENDSVVCYVPGNEKLFVDARVYTKNTILCDGSRAISVEYTKHVNKGYFMSGRKGLYSVSDPYVVKKWEHKYFLRNQEFAHMWIKQSIQKKHSLQEAIEFSQAL